MCTSLRHSDYPYCWACILSSPNKRILYCIVSYLILPVYSRHTDSRVSWGHLYVRPTVTTVFINKHCCSSVLMMRPHHLEKSSLILYALLTVSLVLGRSSRHYVRKTFVAGSLSATLIPLPGLSCVIYSLLTYLLTYFGDCVLSKCW